MERNWMARNSLAVNALRPFEVSVWKSVELDLLMPDYYLPNGAGWRASL